MRGHVGCSGRREEGLEQEGHKGYYGGGILSRRGPRGLLQVLGVDPMPMEKALQEFFG